MQTFLQARRSQDAWPVFVSRIRRGGLLACRGAMASWQRWQLAPQRRGPGSIPGRGAFDKHPRGVAEACRPAKAEDAGSTPAGDRFMEVQAGAARRAERRIRNAEPVGSSPTAGFADPVQLEGRASR